MLNNFIARGKKPLTNFLYILSASYHKKTLFRSLSTWHQGEAFLQQSVSHGLGIQQYLSDVLFEHGSGSLQRQKLCCVKWKKISGHSRWRVQLICFIHELLKLSKPVWEQWPPQQWRGCEVLPEVMGTQQSSPCPGDHRSPPDLSYLQTAHLSGRRSDRPCSVKRRRQMPSTWNYL